MIVRVAPRGRKGPSSQKEPYVPGQDRRLERSWRYLRTIERDHHDQEDTAFCRDWFGRNRRRRAQAAPKGRSDTDTDARPCDRPGACPRSSTSKAATERTRAARGRRKPSTKSTVDTTQPQRQPEASLPALIGRPHDPRSCGPRERTKVPSAYDTLWCMLKVPRSHHPPLTQRIGLRSRTERRSGDGWDRGFPRFSQPPHRRGRKSLAREVVRRDDQ